MRVRVILYITGPILTNFKKKVSVCFLVQVFYPSYIFKCRMIEYGSCVEMSQPGQNKDSTLRDSDNPARADVDGWSSY